jgi:hypothetical protein
MTLTKLKARVDSATGPDRELDELLFEFHNGRKRNISSFEQYEPSEKLPHYTASIDEALTLVEQLLSGWHWSIYDTDGNGKYCAQLEPVMFSYEPFDGRGSTPALSILSALLDALIATPDTAE